MTTYRLTRRGEMVLAAAKVAGLSLTVGFTLAMLTLVVCAYLGLLGG